MLLSAAWGKVIVAQKLKQKISWHCPINRAENGFYIISSEEHFKSQNRVEVPIYNKKYQFYLVVTLSL